MSGFFKKFAVLALTLSAACHDKLLSVPPPLDELHYPTGLALHKLPNGRAALLVVSSNFDLRYDRETGGTLLSIDPEASLDNALGGSTSLAVLGAAQIGSYGGELAVVDANTETCSDYSGTPLALVASRSSGSLYRVQIGIDGSLTCDGSCPIELDSTPMDPYGVLPICTSGSASAYVTYLRGPEGHGWVSRVDLDQSSLSSRDITATTFVLPANPSDSSTNIVASPTGTLAYDSDKHRLYVTSRYYVLNYAPIYWLDLETGGLAGAYSGSVNLGSTVRGIDMHGLALSNDKKRGYLVLQIYDANQAARSGSVVITSAALAVLDLEEEAGAPQVRLVNLVPLDLGANQVRVLPSRGAGVRDLVAVTSPTTGSLAIYDDQSGMVAAAFTRWGDDGAPNSLPSLGLPGTPILGRAPFGLAVDVVGTDPNVNNGKCRLPFGQTEGTPPASCIRIYVGSFGQNVVSVVELDPADPGAAHYVGSFGEAAP